MRGVEGSSPSPSILGKGRKMTPDELVAFVKSMCVPHPRPTEKPLKFLDGREWVERQENADWERLSVERYCNDKYGEEEK